MSQVSDLASMPGHLVRRAQQASNAIFTQECAAYDLTSVQYAALYAIAANPGVDATRLSDLIAFDRSTIGVVLERLEVKGWVERSTSSADKRIKLLQATARGRELLRTVAPAVARVQRRLLAPLSPTDRRTIMRLLAAIAQPAEESRVSGRNSN